MKTFKVSNQKAYYKPNRTLQIPNKIESTETSLNKNTKKRDKYLAEETKFESKAPPRDETGHESSTDGQTDTTAILEITIKDIFKACILCIMVI